jgi:hypothetical protein
MHPLSGKELLFSRVSSPKPILDVLIRIYVVICNLQEGMAHLWFGYLPLLNATQNSSSLNKYLLVTQTE